MGLLPTTIKQIIQDALDCIDKTSSGLSLSGWDNMEKFDACVDVILNHHQYKNKSVEEYFTGLKCSDKFVRAKILGPALNSLKNDIKITIKKFNQKISEYESKNVSRDDQNWFFIFPVNFRLESNGGSQKEFEISENLVRLLDYHDFMISDFWSDELQERLKIGFRDYNNLDKYSWVIIAGEGKDGSFVLDTSFKILKRFLGAINLSYWIYRIPGFWFTQYPRTKGYTEIVTPSYGLRYDSDKNFEGLDHFGVGPAVYKYVDFSEGKSERLKKVFESLNGLDKDSQVYTIIWEALEIYNSALNQIGYDPGFLDLWTGLEKMTFKRRDGRTGDIPYQIIEVFDKRPFLGN
jgi:hypothetical protein